MTMNFNGPQSGSYNDYVIGTQNNYGVEGSVTIGEVRQAVRDLDAALATAPLPENTRRAARDHVRAVEHEVQRDRPDQRTVVDRMERLATLLRSTGSVVTAGSALAGPLRTLATWLGPAAAPLLALLAL